MLNVECVMLNVQLNIEHCALSGVWLNETNQTNQS
jgi:hypothetical protein